MTSCPWRIDWRDGDTGTATHSSGLHLRISRSGWASVMECPSTVSELQATILMAELQRMLTEDNA
jgi:hypothetical protein